jgi:hypothetical protein
MRFREARSDPGGRAQPLPCYPGSGGARSVRPVIRVSRHPESHDDGQDRNSMSRTASRYNGAHVFKLPTVMTLDQLANASLE